MTATVNHERVRLAMRAAAARLPELEARRLEILRARGDIGPAPEPCNHYDGRRCGRPSVARYQVGHRCARHTPAALAGNPEPRPDPEHTLEAYLRRPPRPPVARPYGPAPWSRKPRAVLVAEALEWLEKYDPQPERTARR